MDVQIERAIDELELLHATLEELVDLFWADDGVEEGRAKLRKALMTIRDWLTQAGAEPDSVLQASRAEVLGLNREQTPRREAATRQWGASPSGPLGSTVGCRCAAPVENRFR